MLFFKDFKTFQTTCNAEVLSKVMVIGSIYDDVSSFVVPYDERIKSGDFVFDNHDYVGIVQGVEKDCGTLNITAVNIVNIFNREIIYDGTKPSGSIESYLQSCLEKYFLNLNDAMYRIPYLEFVKKTDTNKAAIPDIDKGICNFKSYISKIRRLYNIFVDFVVDQEKLQVEIYQKPIVTKNIVLKNRPVTIDDETFSENRIAKITSYIEETKASKDWYLLQSGDVVNTPNAKLRSEGRWVILQVANADEVEDAVLNKFKENSYSHKIVFSMPTAEARFDFYDSVKIELNHKIYDSYIATKTDLGNGLTQYQCGELRVTLSDKIKEII